MAISLKTQSSGKEIFEKTFSTISVLFFLGVFVIGSLFFYFSFKEDKRKIELKKERERLMTESQEATLIRYQNKFQEVQKLLDDHFYPTQFLSFLEQKLYKPILFSEIELDFSKAKASSEEKKVSVKISGTAPSLLDLARQYLVFLNTPEFSGWRIEKIGIESETKISFTIS
ncbi:hypothetical protein H5T58_00810, partial [Candidatus Parcubacteria bacterium]|nr:hypothetical protein [Candidatus Parcubacteria bacterium]